MHLDENDELAEMELYDQTVDSEEYDNLLAGQPVPVVD
jgi:hypothetical protein